MVIPLHSVTLDKLIMSFCGTYVHGLYPVHVSPESCYNGNGKRLAEFFRIGILCINININKIPMKLSYFLHLGDVD